jgi:hypothetical protein
MKKRALLIGINYINMPEYRLSGCIDDICNMRNMLIDAYGYNKSNIIMLRDDAENPIMMPTYENIMRELNDIAFSDNDEIWIQYSGHGTQFQNVTDKSLMDNVIVPIDFYNSYIFDYDIYKILLKIRCRAILLFDCCHSGSVGNLPWTFMMEDNKKNSENNGNIITVNNNNNTMPNPNIYLLSGCKDNQTSTDGYNRELSQDVGVFSNAFNECLRDSHHKIDIMTLYKNICNNLIANGYSQRPVLSSSTNIPKYVFSRHCEPTPKINAIITNSFKKNTMRYRMNSVIKNI